MGKVLKSTGRKLQCLSASKKSTSSLTSFLRLQKGHSVIMFTRRGVGRKHQYIKNMQIRERGGSCQCKSSLINY